MINHSAMRPSVVRDRILKSEKECRNVSSNINERDASLRELNKFYGYSNSDGSFGIGKKTHVDLEYVRKYDEIDNHCTMLNENERTQDYNTLSVYEYLLIDGISSGIEQAVLSAAEENINADWYDFIEVRAVATVEDRRKKISSVGGVNKMIEVDLPI